MSENGRLLDSELAPIAEGRLRKDAAAAWNTMNVHARTLGIELVPTGSKSSYRTYAQQVELRNWWCAQGNCDNAAVPGNSNHGWGLAVDLKTTAMRAMLDKIGHQYGWAKEWSDAADEWWHIAWRAGVWNGSDPGPYGTKEQTPQVDTDVATMKVLTNEDGRLEMWAINTFNNPAHRFKKQDGSWSPWLDFQIPSPAVELTGGKHQNGALEIFVRGKDGRHYRNWQDGPNGTFQPAFTAF